MNRTPKTFGAWLCIGLLCTTTAFASSHREAPAITERPQVDGTDFYLFRSYEDGRSDYTTIIANYNPLQDPYGGPNYFPLDDDAVYDIHITNDDDIEEDITFRFKFKQKSPFISLDVGEPGNTQNVAIPLSNAGVIEAGDESLLNVQRSYTVEVFKGKAPTFAQRRGNRIVNLETGERRFKMPFDNIGNKSFPDYETYANDFIYDIDIPGCAEAGKMFVGQRRESFAVNLGEVFDLVNVTNPLGNPDAEASDTEFANITTLALEVPTVCLTEGYGDIIGGWTSAKLPRTVILDPTPRYNRAERHFGRLVQVSRLANPLVNEVAIGLDAKDLFNASHPENDTQFLKYVTNPTLPELLEILFGAAGVEAPNNFPRNDLVWVFLTGIPTINEDGTVGEVMRLNTAIPPAAADMQNPLGVIGGDLAGYPNGRRPGDDTVDISLRAVMGVVCHAGLGVCNPADAPSGTLPFTDGADQNASMFDDQFPYLTTPLPGSPNMTP